MLRCFINHFYCRIRGIVSLRYDRRNVCIPPRRWWDLCRRRTGSWHHLHSYRRRLRFPRRFHIRSLVIAPRQNDCRDCYQQRNQQRVMPRGIDHVDGVVVAVGVEVLRPGVEGGAGVGILREEARRGRVVVAGVHVQQARGVRNAPRATGGCVAARGRCFFSTSCGCQGAVRQGSRVCCASTVRNHRDAAADIV